jgi:hypothetical protein
MMDSQKVHLTGCTLSVRLRGGMGVGATPAVWGGFIPPGGGSRRWPDRLVKWLEETFCEVVK